MNASPVFHDATRYCYGRFGCRVFVETDLLARGRSAKMWKSDSIDGHFVNMLN
ncbi:hypothetical protein [Sphingobium agri]|jgi:hypothetical protein|uniref:hypothetical protein n=1 Tax=Sphingobium agri TaxID=2933566 RepID=UPI001FF56062|nr:hypothetical protein [Sphingobium agri]